MPGASVGGRVTCGVPVSARTLLVGSVLAAALAEGLAMISEAAALGEDVAPSTAPVGLDDAVSPWLGDVDGDADSLWLGDATSAWLGAAESLWLGDAASV